MQNMQNINKFKSWFFFILQIKQKQKAKLINYVYIIMSFWFLSEINMKSYF